MRILSLFFLGTLLSFVPVQAADRGAIIKSCHAALGLSDSGCACIADKVEKEFSEPQLEFFLAVITGDKQRRIAAMGKLTSNEMTIVATRMQQLPVECAAS